MFVGGNVCLPMRLTFSTLLMMVFCMFKFNPTYVIILYRKAPPRFAGGGLSFGLASFLGYPEHVCGSKRVSTDAFDFFTAKNNAGCKFSGRRKRGQTHRRNKADQGGSSFLRTR